MRFNRLLETHFDGCPAILSQYDENRKRTIRMHYLADYPEHAGMCDGVDAWIISIGMRPDLKKIADAIRSGEMKPEEVIQPQNPTRGRVRVALQPTPAEQPTKKERHRVIVPQPVEEAPRANQGRVRTRVQRPD